MTQTWEQVSAQTPGGGWQETNKYILTYSWVGDANDGSVPDTQSIVNVNGYIVLVVTDPGTPAPTDNYDVELIDANGCDVMGGALTNRDASASEQAVPQIQGGVYGGRYVAGRLTLKIANQSVKGARGVVSADAPIIAGNSDWGLFMLGQAVMICENMILTGNGTGAYAACHGTIRLGNSTITGNGTGLNAYGMSYMHTYNCTYENNGTNTTPAINTVGNKNSLIDDGT